MLTVILAALCTFAPSAALNFKRETNKTVSLAANFHINGFYVNGSVGTPPQDVMLAVNFASADVWANDNHCAGYNPEPEAENHVLGPEKCLMPGYQYNLSTSANSSNTNKILYQAAYNDGWLVKDNFTIGDITLANFDFGQMSELRAVYENGNLGLCPTYEALSVLVSSSTEYEVGFLLDRLKDEGYILAQIASVYFGDGTGLVLLGGIDDAKYAGDLRWFYSYGNEGTIAADGFGFGGDGVGFHLYLELGAMLNVTFVPEVVFDYMVEYLSGDVITADRCKVDCGYLDDTSTFFNIYTLSGNISAPVLNLVKKFDDGKCYLSVVPSDLYMTIQAGYDFFHHLYIVADYDRLKFGFAPILVTDKSDIDSSGDTGEIGSVSAAMFRGFTSLHDTHTGYYASSLQGVPVTTYEVYSGTYELVIASWTVEGDSWGSSAGGSSSGSSSGSSGSSTQGGSGTTTGNNGNGGGAKTTQAAESSSSDASGSGNSGNSEKSGSSASSGSSSSGNSAGFFSPSVSNVFYALLLLI